MRIQTSIMRGAAASFARVTGDTIEAQTRRDEIGLPEIDYRVVSKAMPWMAEDLARVRMSLVRFFDGAKQLAGMPPDGIILAEEAAVVIAQCVDPCNWAAAATLSRISVEGSALVGGLSDDEREHVRPTVARMRALIYHAYENATDIQSLVEEPQDEKE